MIFYAVVLSVFLFCLFVLVMHFKRLRDSRGLEWYEKIIAYPLAVAGVVLDAFVNITIATIIFLDLPKEFMLTDRLTRYIYHPKYDKTWRERLAGYINVKLIEPHDKGHI